MLESRRGAPCIRVALCFQVTLCLRMLYVSEWLYVRERLFCASVGPAGSGFLNTLTPHHAPSSFNSSMVDSSTAPTNSQLVF